MKKLLVLIICMLCIANAGVIDRLGSAILSRPVTGGAFGGSAPINYTLNKVGTKVPWGGTMFILPTLIGAGLTYFYDELKLQSGTSLDTWRNNGIQPGLSGYMRNGLDPNKGYLNIPANRSEIESYTTRRGCNSHGPAYFRYTKTINNRTGMYVESWIYKDGAPMTQRVSIYYGYEEDMPGGLGYINTFFWSWVATNCTSYPTLEQHLISNPTSNDAVKTIIHRYLIDNAEKPMSYWSDNNLLGTSDPISINQWFDDLQDCLVDSDYDQINDCSEVDYNSDPSDPASVPNFDPDADGLPDSMEDQLGTDRHNPDTDNDGVNDGTEHQLGMNPRSNDTDNDGLFDKQELDLGTDPKNPDTDGDGLPDGDELAPGTDPKNPDTDGDGLPDGDEITRGTDPKDPDTDNDGRPDGQEITDDTNPLTPDCADPDEQWNTEIGECKPVEPPVVCPQGQHPNESGQCVPDPVNCPAGQEYSEIQNKCVPKQVLPPDQVGSAACQIVSASTLETWAAQFWDNSILLNRCLWIPVKPAADYLQEVRNVMNNKFPFSLASKLQASMIGGSGGSGGVPSWLPTTFGKWTLDFAPWLALFVIMSGGFKLAMSIRFFSWLIDKISGQVVIS